MILLIYFQDLVNNAKHLMSIASEKYFLTELLGMFT